MSSSYVLTDTGPEVVLVTRNEKLERKKLYIKYFPYFFVKEEDFNLLLASLQDGIKDKFLSTSYGFKGIDGKSLIKVTVEEPGIISDINHQAKLLNLVLYESNIPFNYRFLIDNYLITGIDPVTKKPVKVESRHKRVFIDIEVLSDAKPDPNKDQLIVIGIYDLTERVYHSIFVGENFNVNLDVLKSEVKNVELHPCSDEYELIEQLAILWSRIQPDIAVSFGDFDIPYIVTRLLALNISPSFLSPVYSVSLSKDAKNIVKCLHIIDYEYLYRIVYGEPMWNTLEYVSNKVLGHGKIKLDDSIVNTWFNDYTKIVEYNLRDVELIKDIDAALGLIDSYLLFIWSETGLDLEDCFLANRIGDITHLRWLDRKYIFKSESDIPKEKYEGALVVADKTGLLSNVAVFDWNELYPSIMDIFHISIDTLDPFGDIVITDKMKFTSSKHGWTNEIMKPFRDRRQQIKKQVSMETDKKVRDSLKLLSQALKVISNAQYGLYGQKTDKFTSRFYDPRIAGAITYIGREVTMKIKEFAENLGYEVAYRDTDSCFILLKTNAKEEREKLRVTLENNVNDYLHNKYGVTGNLRLDLEYVAAKALILAKKRYHVVKENGEEVIKGLNIVRKDSAPITVEEQEVVGKMRLNGVSIEDTRKYVNKRFNDVRLGREPIEKIMVLGRCNKKKYPKITRNFKALLYSQKLGIDIPLGSRFWWVYIYPKESIVASRVIKVKTDKGERKKVVEKEYPADVIAFMDVSQIPSDVIIDYSRMAEYTIGSPLSRYIEEEKVIRQKSLSDYSG